MGFFWFAPAIYFWSRSRRLAWGLIVLGLIHGGLMGFARMAQGAHWMSDVMWAGGIVYLSSWILYRVLNTPLASPTSLAVEEPFSNSVGVAANDTAKLG
jgi:lipid A 4'-phosphatase